MSATEIEISSATSGQKGRYARLAETEQELEDSSNHFSASSASNAASGDGDAAFEVHVRTLSLSAVSFACCSRLHVFCSAGMTTTLLVHATDSVLQLKEQLSTRNEIGVLPEFQTLIFAGQQLADQVRLCDCSPPINVSCFQSVRCSLPSQAGCVLHISMKTRFTQAGAR